MIILGIEGPSHAGKSTFVELIRDKLNEIGYSVISFPCYMDSINQVERARIPVDTSISIKDEMNALALFIQVEKSRRNYIKNNRNLDVVILDRTFITLLAHNYAMTKLTKIDFYKPTLNLLTRHFHELVLPDFFVYINTAQKIMNKRYPINDTSVFCNPVYNTYFKQGYFVLKKTGRFIKESFEFRVETEKLINKALADILTQIRG